MTDQLKPIPISERLPGPEDCDDWPCGDPSPGRWCWWWDDDYEHWLKWSGSDNRLLCWTHWLPAHAIPTPQENIDV